MAEQTDGGALGAAEMMAKKKRSHELRDLLCRGIEAACWDGCFACLKVVCCDWKRPKLTEKMLTGVYLGVGWDIDSKHPPVMLPTLETEEETECEWWSYVGTGAKQDAEWRAFIDEFSAKAWQDNEHGLCCRLKDLDCVPASALEDMLSKVYRVVLSSDVNGCLVLGNEVVLSHGETFESLVVEADLNGWHSREDAASQRRDGGEDEVDEFSQWIRLAKRQARSQRCAETHCKGLS